MMNDKNETDLALESFYRKVVYLYPRAVEHFLELSFSIPVNSISRQFT